ncbi:MAG TPA: pyridoxal-dependent decarboxylase, partial [Actinomycetota bacterium]|nr:pyridoxal-dependent decarboxylase [Actinomycetota bacterium]
MVHRQVSKDDPEAGGAVAPAYTHRLDLEPIPKFVMPEHDARPETVYRLIHDELLLDGSSRLNLATFVTTWMEPEADKLMAEAFDKNMIDKDEYPRTADLEMRCVSMLSRLWNSPDEEEA